MKRKKIQSLFDITIGQYQKMAKIENITNHQIISIIYDIPYEIVLDVPEKQINAEAENIKQILNEKQNFIRKYKGLGFEPDLDNMSAGAFADAYEYSKNISQLHLFTSVLYRPIKKDYFYYIRSKKYNITPYKSALEREEEVRELPLALLYSAQGFFLRLQKSYLNVIQKRIQAKSRRPSQLLKRIGSIKTGVGVLNSMQSQVETTLKLIGSQKNLLVKSFGI